MSLKTTVSRSRATVRERPPVRNSSISPEHVRAVDRARQVVDALELDVARAGDALGQVARVAHVDQAVAGAVQDQRRDAQLAEQVG